MTRHIPHLLCCLITVTLMLSTAASARAQVVWSQEFDGSAIDRSVWTYDVGGGGFGNGQLEYDTARHENSYIEDGKLVLEARREAYQGNAFTSARMTTHGRFAFQYGTLEARIKLPDTADGIWPAFWLLGDSIPAVPWPKCGEIDILEAGGRDGIKNGTQTRSIDCALHYAGADGNHASKVAWYTAPTNLSRGYHTYKLTWTPDSLKFYLDGTEYGSYDISGEAFRAFHRPFFIILNVAVGSGANSYTGISQPAQVTAPFPCRMVVDWIHLTKNSYTKIFRGAQAQTGAFGVLNPKAATTASLNLIENPGDDFLNGSDATLYAWNNMKRLPPTELDRDVAGAPWSFEIAPDSWFGLGVFTPQYRNMESYSDGLLHFDVRTTAPTPFRVGIAAANSGTAASLPVGDEHAEWGFPRDGVWHSVALPLNRFGNTDFRTVHQFFTVSGDAPTEKTQVDFDNVWWEPSGPRPRPTGGAFGIYTDIAAHRSAGAFPAAGGGGFFVWENTLVPQPSDGYEGSRSLSYASAAGKTWFGAAFTPNMKYDLSGLGPAAKLRFALKTSSETPFQIGMKSGNVDGIGQKWIPFAAGSDPYGFVRDGRWHRIEIPLAAFEPEVDLSAVSQLFEILGTDGGFSNLEMADIYIAG